MSNAFDVADAEISSRENGEDRINPHGGRLLTKEQWDAVMPPLVSIKVEFPQWTDVEYDIALKYALRIATGWVYFANKRFIFEKTEDYAVFKLWLSANPMTGNDIEVE